MHLTMAAQVCVTSSTLMVPPANTRIICWYTAAMDYRAHGAAPRSARMWSKVALHIIVQRVRKRKDLNFRALRYRLETCVANRQSRNELLYRTNVLNLVQN